MAKITIILFIPILLLLVSCASEPMAEAPLIDEFQGAGITPKPAKKHIVPDNITDELIPDFNQAVAAQPKIVKPVLFDISVHEIDAREFFMGLVVDTDKNMLLHPDVGGNITLELKNVTVAQVLEAVHKVYGYDYKDNDIGYIIYPASLQTQFFKINRLDLVRVGQSSTLVSTGQVSSNSNSNRNNNDNNNAQNLSSQNNNSNSNQSSGSSSWIKTHSATDFWLELETTLQAIISVDKDASVVINKQSGIIVVRAKPMQLREVENFIDMTQNQLNRQVILEAKIIEVILDDGHQTGVNWENIIREGINKAPLLTGLGAVSVVQEASTVFSIGASQGDFRAFVRLLETQGKTNILSSPRISTLNNQKAIIKVGQDEYFITDVSSNNSASTTTITLSQDITWTPFFSGISLDVTPQINDEDEITLHIHPSITRVESQVKNFIVGDSQGSVPLALNTVRESDSIVKVKDGQVIVLGGLMQETTDENKEGIAGLTRIPWLGNLFRKNNGRKQKSELVILLKSSLANNQADWQREISASQRNIKRLQQVPRWK